MGSQGEKSVWTECEWRTGETQKVRRLGWKCWAHMLSRALFSSACDTAFHKVARYLLPFL